MAEHHRKKTPKRLEDVRKNALKWKWSKKENYQKTRDYEFKRAYGLTIEKRDEIMRTNGGLCHICNDKPSECIDHCHNSGVIRGALCTTCNWMLGQGKDNPKILRAGAEYLERFAS